MTAWALSALDRMSPRARSTVTVLIALLALAAVMAALTLSAASLGPRSRRPTLRPPASEAASRPSSRRLPVPVSAARLAVARRVAVRFLDNYLQLAYGHGVLVPASEVTPALRHQLTGERTQITPVERHRHPHVVSLHLVGMTPGFVLATVIVQDGGISAYRLRLTLQRDAGGWDVSGVGEG